MENKWDYKIDIKNEKAFATISEMIGTDFPEDLKEFILAHNAASPEMNCVDINDIEYGYDETLSFNEDEEEATTALFVLDNIECDGYIPFARDPFGNYFLYAIDSGNIAYYSHEEQSVDDSEMDLEMFISSLH